MTQLDYTRFAAAARGNRKWTRILALGLAVAALMALSFALGRATIGHAGSFSPASDQSVIQPVNPLTGGAQVGCRLHNMC